MVGRTGRLACACAICIPLLFRAEGLGRAGALEVGLEYASPRGCPDAGDFKAVVTRRLGYDPFRDDAQDRVLVRIAPRGQTVEGRVEWRDAAGRWTGERIFPSRSNDCRELVSAMGFALALQLQLLAMAGVHPESSGVPPAESSRPPAAEPPGRSRDRPPADAPTLPPAPPMIPISAAPRGGPGFPDAARSPGRGPRPEFAVGAGASVGFGLSSKPVALARLFGTMAGTHLGLELAGEVSLPTTTQRADGASFSQWVLFVSAAGCGSFEWWSACLLAKAGEVRAMGQDIDIPVSSSAPVVETGLRLSLTRRLGGHVYMAARADGLLNLTRWTVTLDNTPVWTAPRFAGTVGLDGSVRFP